MNRQLRRQNGIHVRVTEPDAHPVNLRTRRRNPGRLRKLGYTAAREAEKAQQQAREAARR